MSATIQRNMTVLVVGHGLAGKLTVSALMKFASGNLRIVVVESRDFYEADVLAPAFIAKPDLYAKVSTAQALSREAGVQYVHDVVESIVAPQSTGKPYSVDLKSGAKIEAQAVICCVGSSVPLVKPETGVTQEERDRQLASARKAIGAANRILVGGAGAVAVEMAGTACALKSASAKVLLAVSGETVLSDAFPPAVRARTAAYLASQGVEILKKSKVIGPEPLDFSAAPATYKLAGGSTVHADVFLPAFATFSLPFVAHVDGATDARGRLVVDGKLQSVKLPGVFAVACASADTILNIDIITGAAKTAAFNASAFLLGAPLQAYKRAAPELKSEPWLNFQLGEYSWLNLPAKMRPLSFCCGWPLPCVCCLPGCCTPCGYSCANPEGKGVSQCFRMMLVDCGGLPHLKKMKKPGNSSAAPTPATMVH